MRRDPGLLRQAISWHLNGGLLRQARPEQDGRRDRRAGPAAQSVAAASQRCADEACVRGAGLYPHGPEHRRGLKMKLAETFTSIQGEGHLTGKLMRFIRLAGCSVTQCPLHPANKARLGDCDTDWKFRFTGDPERLAAEALDEVGPNGWASITGGEPFDQPEEVAALIAELKRRGLLVNIQTSGTKWVTCPWD